MFESTRKFLTYILTSNVPELIPYLAFVLFRIPLPLTIIQILAVDLGNGIFATQAFNPTVWADLAPQCAAPPR